MIHWFQEERETETETERGRNRERQRLRDRETERDRERSHTINVIVHQRTLGKKKGVITPRRKRQQKNNKQRYKINEIRTKRRIQKAMK